jgi:hypothetical protein
VRAVLALAIALACVASPAQAHRPSDAFLTLEVDGARVRGNWEIALRDLAVVVALDADRDRAITWGELHAALPAIADAVGHSLRVSADGRSCALRARDLQVDDRVEGRFAWIELAGECPVAPEQLGLDYHLLFDVDPTHRGILVLSSGGTTHSAVFAPDHASVSIALDESSAWQQFADYLREGIHHIWIGADHILFLISLLLPCVLVPDEAVRRGRLRPVMAGVLGVVTAFTLAHSLTLGLAAFGVLRLPTSLTESAIALSVLFAATNNLVPMVTRGRWRMAFGFGLVHGFGFASVLGELGLPASARLLALVAFNLGVEVGQLSIVVVALPLAYALRDTAFYRRAVLGGGSLAVGFVAVCWFAQRSGLLSPG